MIIIKEHSRVHVKTFEEYRELCEYLGSLGLRWACGTSFKSIDRDNQYYSHKEKTYIDISNGRYGNIERVDSKISFKKFKNIYILKSRNRIKIAIHDTRRNIKYS